MVVNEDHTSGALSEGGPQNLPRVHERRRQRPDGDQRMHDVMVLGVQEDRPEVLLVVIVLAQEIPGELRYCRGTIKGSGRGRTGLPDHRPRCELEPIPPSRHDRTDASRGRSPSARRVLSSALSPPAFPLPRNRIRSARTSAVMCLFPRASAHTRVCNRPSTRTLLPLRRYLAARSPSAAQATT